MGKPKRTAAQKAFLRDVAKKLNDYIERHEIEKTKAARELRISKQRLHKYLQGDMMPGSDFLCRVAKCWNLEFSYRNHSFGSAAFTGTANVSTASVEQLDLELFEIPQIMNNGAWEVQIHRRDPKRIELSIEIRRVS